MQKAVTIRECCWKPIEGDSFELDDLTVCAECYEYHGGKFDDGNDI